MSGMLIELAELLSQPSIDGVVFVLFLAWVALVLGAEPLHARVIDDTKF